MVLGARPTTSASTSRTITDESNFGTNSDISDLSGAIRNDRSDLQV
jgi:hypothetical protein